MKRKSRRKLKNRRRRMVRQHGSDSSATNHDPNDSCMTRPACGISVLQLRRHDQHSPSRRIPGCDSTAGVRCAGELCGLSTWWTPHLSGRYEAGSVFTAGFPDVGPEPAIAELKEPARVLWRCSGGPEEWIGTWVSFDPGRRRNSAALPSRRMAFGERACRSLQHTVGVFSAWTEVIPGARRASGLRSELRADQQLVTLSMSA